MSSNEVADGVEVIERDREGGYQRMIFQGSELVGVQAVNWCEEIGHLLASIVRKEKVADIADAFSKRKSPLRVRPFVHVQW
jgi:hypothetical protein